MVPTGYSMKMAPAHWNKAEGEWIYGACWKKEKGKGEERPRIKNNINTRWHPLSGVK